MIKYNSLILLSLLLVMGCFHNLFGQKILSLEETLNIAIENSPEMQKAQLNMERTDLLLKAQLASLKSQIAFQVSPINFMKSQNFDALDQIWFNQTTYSSGGGLSVTQPIKFSDGTLKLQNTLNYSNSLSERGPLSKSQIGFDNNLFIEYAQPLFLYNKTKMNLERHELSLQNATLDYSLQFMHIEQVVTQRFYSLYNSLRSLEISEEEMQNQKLSLDIIKSKVEAGLSPREELLQAELNYATGRSSLEQKYTGIEDEKDAFKQLIGLPIETEFSIVANFKYKKVEIDLEKAIEYALEQRMELQQRNINMKRAEFELIETSAQKKFNGELGLSLGVSGNDRLVQNIYDQPTTTPRVGVSLYIPIYDWGERKARIKAAQINIETQKIDNENYTNEIILNLRKIDRSLQNLETQIMLAKQREEKSQLTYEINLERYKNGDLTSMDLQRYQNQMSSAKMDYSVALINHKLELLNLKIQSLWDFENNSSFVPQRLQNNMTNTLQPEN